MNAADVAFGLFVLLLILLAYVIGRIGLGGGQDGTEQARQILAFALTGDAPLDHVSVVALAEQAAWRIEDARRLKVGYELELHETATILGRALGYPHGPFPEICPTCSGGPCTDPGACVKHIEWGEHTTVTLAMQAEELLGEKR